MHATVLASAADDGLAPVSLDALRARIDRRLSPVFIFRVYRGRGDHVTLSGSINSQD